MEDLFYNHDREREEDVRTSLLSYYSSKCASHVTYILTIALAIFAFLEVFPQYFNIDETLSKLILSLILSAFFAIASRTIIRTVYWAYFADAALNVKPLTYRVTVERRIPKQFLEISRAGIHFRLHLACRDFVCDRHHGIYRLATELKFVPIFWAIYFIGILHFFYFYII